MRTVHVTPAPPLPVQHRDALLRNALDSDYCEIVRHAETARVEAWDEIDRLARDIVIAAERAADLRAELAEARAELAAEHAEVVHLRGLLGIPTITRRVA